MFAVRALEWCISIMTDDVFLEIQVSEKASMVVICNGILKI